MNKSEILTALLKLNDLLSASNMKQHELEEAEEQIAKIVSIVAES